MLVKLLGIAFLSVLAPLASYAHENRHMNRHHDLAKRAAGDVHLFKRHSNARWSFYDVEVGAGACGVWNKPSDFTVALNADQFGNPSTWPGPQCFKTITMRYNGKTATATIMDKCPGCPYGGLDLTRGLFNFFDSQDKGIIYGEWWFGGEEAKEATTTKATTTWKPEPATTWKPEPTTVWTPEPTTTWVAATTHSTSSWSLSSVVSSVISTSSVAPSSDISSASASLNTTSASSASTSSSFSYSSGAASGLALPTGIVDQSASQPQNINALNNLFINLGSLIGAGARA